EEISVKIQDIQTATGATVQSISRIVGTIDSVRTIAAAIAGAVEEQSTATQEIAAAAHGGQHRCRAHRHRQRLRALDRTIDRRLRR
ncbi:hypothetical protein J8J27_31055, partial [Mycobacterium tuberculosis]|nr:hypothetical protein [Mycobacterium tuberculosis]